MSIGERITGLRKELNISQGDLAEALEVSRQAISKWENDLACPDTFNLIRLADLLDTDIEYLATGRRSYQRRPPKVITTVQTVEKIVEKPVIQEKIVEKVIEKPVVRYLEKPVYVEKPIIKHIERIKYRKNPTEIAIFCIISFVIGLIFGIMLF